MPHLSASRRAIPLSSRPIAQPGVSGRIAFEEQSPQLRQDSVGRVSLSEFLDKHTESVAGLLRVELIEVRDDLVDPMEQLDVIEIRQTFSLSSFKGRFSIIAGWVSLRRDELRREPRSARLQSCAHLVITSSGRRPANCVRTRSAPMRNVSVVEL